MRAGARKVRGIRRRCRQILKSQCPGIFTIKGQNIEDFFFYRNICLLPLRHLQQLRGDAEPHPHAPANNSQNSVP
jgi:hypothetical protein